MLNAKFMIENIYLWIGWLDNMKKIDIILERDKIFYEIEKNKLCTMCTL